jgi:hypothetical protein
VSVFPELSQYLDKGESGGAWKKFRALNPEGGGGVNDSDGKNFLRTIQVVMIVITMAPIMYMIIIPSNSNNSCMLHF